MLKCETFSKSSSKNALETTEKHCVFVSKFCCSFRDSGTERYTSLEEILEGNHVYQIFPVLYTMQTTWSMILSFQKIL